ncbi:4Fe-4S dicluster domain-containing protein [Solidesulfovibrio carbinolicus]|uniref:4Fe-4S dicluster domain-containing protein n=1 Tax=Solidesulfovibrio carbinolicus TaxID=296842 RepID=UPI001F19ACA9|nr:4Fe-4S dicluster domain-containing protein [Solidesulfovibrio carbinolicus]
MSVTPGACIGCRACELACAAAHMAAGATVGSMTRPPVPRLYLVREGGTAAPVACRHCEAAPCAAVCPTAAVRCDASGVVVEPARCIGCKACLAVCPVGAMALAEVQDHGRPVLRRVPDPAAPGGFVEEPAWLASKCDLCRERPAGPACVGACPVGALSLVVPGEVRRVRLLAAARAMAAAASGAREEGR